MKPWGACRCAFSLYDRGGSAVPLSVSRRCGRPSSVLLLCQQSVAAAAICSSHVQLSICESMPYNASQDQVALHTIVLS